MEKLAPLGKERVEYTTDGGNLVKKIGSTGCSGMDGDSGYPPLYGPGITYHFAADTIAGRKPGKKDYGLNGECGPVNEPDPARHPNHSGRYLICAQCIPDLRNHSGGHPIRIHRCIAQPFQEGKTQSLLHS